MNAHRVLIVLALGVLTATPAMADRPAYCAAYATDFANARAKDKVLWQHKYDIALDACLQTESVKQVNESPTPKVVTPKKKKEKVVVAETVPAPEAPVAAPTKLVVGSDDWKIYCANKYTSFNPITGTYISKTGVERKCVVSST